jgi:hypothetical protein
MLKFAGKYKLKKAIPNHAAGSVLRWDGIDGFFYFDKPKSDPMRLNEPDRDAPRYSVNVVQDPTWFAPIGELRPFIPAFPSEKRINEYVDLTADCRMVNTIDVCRAINALIEDKGFQHRLYEFYKQQYESFHALKTDGD